MDKSLKANCIGEFLGTALLIFFGVGCVAALKVAGASFGLWEISIMWGMGVALAVYATAGLSGAHLNPAVTIALWKFACFDGKKVIPYIISQMLGAFFAAALVYALYRNVFIDYETAHNIVRGTQESLSLAGTFSTYPHPSLSIGGAFAVEFVITAILMALIMALTDDGNGVPRGPLAPLLIGILIAVIGGAMGPLTGFAMNPARDFGPKFFAYLAGWGELALTGGREVPYFIVPMVAPVLGALAGAWLYKKAIGGNLPCNCGCE
ncbi:TPA: MIP/aquaporin family protein [Haemophilus influenzae]|uniref:Glycerophosphodiester phosphodiesterase n=2 Tax=Haemophilus influenzae TaxID=727 RepID=A5UHH6_HAEIG|nr:MIP/aquaporin family protein [Haemophilus influenzae]ABR00232.1 glycerophosphodiester phosphodiesterase [Haemophilus influenzae PittGG]EDJ87902.1 glycerol kinase [Haemophilus influenzae 22.1-21]AXH82458.1 aquaporin [Haemophilus influenzae]AXP55653.1 aquaporin [Haemophilus influenzae]KMZ27383.1 glycerol uptake facilitator GlpF [Haemophilus influenzae]